MRYHYDKRKQNLSLYGFTYECNHPVYDRCTLYLSGNKGLAVIQQRYDKTTKHTWWSEIDNDLIDTIYLNTGFVLYFNKYAAEPINGIYPTITVRQIMWALRLKPLKKDIWETSFDHKPI